MEDLTNDIPKPLLKINNKTLISYALEIATKLPLSNIYVNTHYQADKLNQYLIQEYPHIIISHENLILGTGGGIKKVQKQYVATSTLTYSNGTATGDGSTTAFTINSGRSVNDVIVSVNGFIFVPTTDYTISGTTLTFAAAPASSAEINIRYLPLSGTGTFTNQTATGDGSTTTLTISSGRAVENVIVTVNGITLVPSTDYSISGTTLTFATAPAASAEISIRFLRLT